MIISDKKIIEDSTKRVIIADDEESIRTTLEFILQDNGYHVESVSNGSDIIKKVREKFFNIAILDYKLPDTDGVSLGREIRDITPYTELIILTGKATLESAIKAVKEDIYEYLTKPIDPDKLIEVINGALNKQQLIIENRRLMWELKKSNKELEKLNKFKDGLISMISHDLRSPISSLKGFNDAFLKGYVGELTEEQKEIIQTENETIDVMIELINSILDMRQIEAGKLKMNKEPADIKKDIYEPVLKRLKPSFEERNIKVKTECEKDLPEVYIDKARISQVIQNLVQNAVKFTPRGGEIILGASKTKGNQIELSVRDTGKGISKDSINSIFEIFYTESKGDSNRNRMGRGLGLAICKEIIKAHDGTIWAESEGKGKGSTFFVVLPIEKNNGNIKKR